MPVPTGASRQRRLPRRPLLWGGAAGVLLAACGHAPASRSASGAGPTSLAPGQGWLYLTILTGRMLGRPGFPEFVPADFQVPAHALVHGEIRCFDGGAATIPAGYQRVRGTTDGAMTVIAAVHGDLAGTRAQTLEAVDAKAVAHTLTIPAIGLNIPVPPLHTVRFTFDSGAAGAHRWQCMAGCGTGQGGWGGPMATPGYMNGTLRVV